ncbi:MAG: CDGSH iron-sulfur domain-containing protein [Planctomycetota bacterium]|nr:MAG: CDGSH iron-sulfur domain-containing protein [Planctomycetota bacterium]
MSEPNVPQKAPYVEDLEPGTYAWCSCGRTANQPHCDGAHKGTDFKPEIVKIEEAGKVAWCGCRHSGKGAICDGSHRNL